MKTRFSFFIVLSFLTLHCNCQVLNIPEVIQENDEWCWAGVSKSVLDYYGYPLNQCEIAEYARQVVTWTSYGTADCCINPNVGCNYWNYNWGSDGSIQDILIHFGNIQNYGSSAALTLNQIGTQILAGRPFIVRWGWSDGGGHFVVGHGKINNDIYYMDPWFGEGLHISTYNWLVNDGNHTWTHTNIISTNLNIQDLNANQKVSIYPNPVKDFLSVGTEIDSKKVFIYSQLGQLVESHSMENKATIDVSHLQQGIYLFKIQTHDNKTLISKFVKE